MDVAWWGSTFVTVDQPQPPRPCCSVFLRGQCLIHCFSYCTRRTAGRFPNCRGAGLLHPWVRRRFTDLRSLLRLWYSAASWSTHPLHWLYGSMDAEEPPQTQCGEDRVHLAGISPSSCHLFLRPYCRQWRSCPAVTNGSLTMSPGWQGLAIFRFDSFGRFEDHRPSSPATPLFAQWSYHNWTIATVYLEGPWRTYLASSPVSWGLLHDLSWCSLGKVTWLAKFMRGCTGLICRRECNSSSAALCSGIYAVLLPRIWRLLHSSQLNWGTLTALIGFSSHAPGQWQLAPGRSWFPLLPCGTVSRSIFVIPASVFPVLGRNWKPTYLILPLDCLFSFIIQFILIYS